MTKDGINYAIHARFPIIGSIELAVYDDGVFKRRYDGIVTYQTNPEIDEVIEEIKETKTGQWVNDENDQPKWEVTTHEEIIQAPTGNKVPNPNYRNPQSIADLEAICIEHGFTK